MSVHIVTDSTARFASDEYKRLPITVMPLHIHFGDKAYLDGVDIDEKQFFQLLKTAKEPPRALPPTIEEFNRLYNKLYAGGNDVISIHLPSRLGRTCENAQRAASTLLGQCKIEVIDGATTSLGLGILAEAAARETLKGESLDNIVRHVRGIIPQIYIVFFADKLNDLKHADGIGQAQALLGTMLGIKPLFTLEEGEILPIEKVKTREAAIEKLIEFVTEFDAIHQVAIIKNSNESTEETVFITEQLHEVFPEIAVPVITYSPVLASYVGPNALGVVVYEDTSFEI
ncbi:MAG: DegV family protein [Anaerolineae bacterium]|nr:DegV family protein [Anaerolineae bacterium]